MRQPIKGLRRAADLCRFGAKSEPSGTRGLSVVCGSGGGLFKEKILRVVVADGVAGVALYGRQYRRERMVEQGFRTTRQCIESLGKSLFVSFGKGPCASIPARRYIGIVRGSCGPAPTRATRSERGPLRQQVLQRAGGEPRRTPLRNAALSSRAANGGWAAGVAPASRSL